MNRPIPILSALLAVQLLLAAILFAGGGDIGAYVSNEKLIGLDLSAVDAIIVDENGPPVLTLKRQGKGWVLPDHHGFPASEEKVQRVAGELLALTKGWPVATAAASAKHFKVDDGDFERKISFMKEGQALKTLLMGTSPGFKKVHVRLEGSDEIYAVSFTAFSPYEAAAAADNWTDKAYLKLKEGDVVRAELPELALVREESGLKVEEMAEKEETQEEKARELLGRLAGVSFLSVLGTEGKPEYKLDAPAYRYTLKPKTGDAVTYVFGQSEGDKDFVLKTSAHPYYFKVSQYTLERIREWKREELVKPKEEKPANTGAAGKARSSEAETQPAVE